MPALSDPLWVITSYYNPARYETRRRNYEIFRKYLNAPLLTIELSQSGKRQLSNEDADVVVDLVGEDRIWQKERLLNIALHELPAHVEHVAWIDCDVVFEDDSWPNKAQRRLARDGGLLHLFETAIHLPREASALNLSPTSCAEHMPILSQVSLAGMLPALRACSETNKGSTALRADNAGNYRLADRSAAVGLAWAANRAALGGGFYDRNVIGGGDSVQTFAALNQLDEYFAFRRLTPAHRADMRMWADAAKSTHLFANVGTLDSKLYHLWHGAVEHRDYRGRHDILYRNDFDPRRDIRHAPNGTWAWSDPCGALADEVGAYFFTRHEDLPPGR